MTTRDEVRAEAWTDERIREAFIYDGGEAEYHDPINGAKEQRRSAGEVFDTWLAAHDRALLDGAGPKSVPDDEREALVARLRDHAAGIDLLAHGTSQEGFDMRSAADLLESGACRQGPITDDWEYGIRPVDDEVPLGVSPMPTLEAAQTRANNIRGGWVIVRRRKAGPWEPLEAARDAS